MKPITTFLIIALCSSAALLTKTGYCSVVKEGKKTFLIDRTGEKWDITQAVSIGFNPRHFEYGLGKDAIIPLDDSIMQEETENVPSKLRIIGVARGRQARAYAVPKLAGHEIANSTLGTEPVAAAY